MKPFTFILVLFGSIVAYQSFANSNRPQSIVSEPTIIPSPIPNVPVDPVEVAKSNEATLDAICASATKEFEAKDRENWQLVERLKNLNPVQKANLDRETLRGVIYTKVAELEVLRSKMKSVCPH
jgi:hypothetical protein